jgi:hypothetical protein
MSNPDHLAILTKGVGRWNKWREANEDVRPDLVEADLSGAKLNKVDFSGADLKRADFSGAELKGADLNGADLKGADFNGADLNNANLNKANLREADLSGADLSAANLSGADLSGANLSWANLSGADLSDATLGATVLMATDLSNAQDLKTCRHRMPSGIDHRTLERSGPLPDVFLRGCGLPNTLIDFLPSLLTRPIQYYSCFISYSSHDQAFAQRLHADLQAKGVRCWFAPEDMKIGDKIRDRIDDAIRIHDKLLLILSEQSVASDWVETEVERAFSEERRRKTTVLFPVRLDDTVMQTTEAWASQIYDTRNIGNFHQWKNHDAYQTAFNRLVRDLKPELEKKPLNADNKK